MSDENIIVAYCGLVCTNCGQYKRGKCLGCHSEKPMNRNCAMKKCAMSRNYLTCAECTEFENLKECKKLYNLISRFFGFIFKTDRIGNLYRIREIGLEEFKKERAISGKM